MGNSQLFNRILLGTGNSAKVREMTQIFRDCSITFTDLIEFPGITEVTENGTTFAENAKLKACEYARQTGLPTLADDSGLEVAALNGGPGIYSARYGGDGLSDADKMVKLLRELRESGLTDRSARFVCVMTLADKNGNFVYSAEGICSGVIAEQQMGENGFGYDPIFIPNGYHQSFGQLSGNIKQKISHRNRAAERIISFLCNNTVD